MQTQHLYGQEVRVLVGDPSAEEDLPLLRGGEGESHRQEYRQCHYSQLRLASPPPLPRSRQGQGCCCKGPSSPRQGCCAGDRPSEAAAGSGPSTKRRSSRSCSGRGQRRSRAWWIRKRAANAARQAPLSAIPINHRGWARDSDRDKGGTGECTLLLQLCAVDCSLTRLV